jgi:hypothetical protein
VGITRLKLWSELVAVSVVEPILNNAYRRESEREWLEGGEAPHGAPWFSSFHASSFPGADPYACGRAAVYGLMGLPPEKPIEPSLRAWFNLGTRLEHDWVSRFAAEGVLLSKSPAVGDRHQTNFEDREHWLTGASDAIILPAFWRKAHCVEIKTTSDEKVVVMNRNPADTPKSHEKYIRQLKTYISLANEAPFTPTVSVCTESWAITTPLTPDSPLRWCPVHQTLGCETETFEVEPPDDGTLIYSSREQPMLTSSYYFCLDEDMMAVGREKLAEWRDAYLADLLPAHPREKEKAKWSVPPCQWCQFKKPCKIDFSEKISEISESNQIAAAKAIRPSYDYLAMREAVLARWT